VSERNLYIFEKPNTGKEFASWLSRKIGLPQRHGDGLIMIGSDHVVTWCIGHLLKLKDIDEYLKENGIAQPNDIKNDGTLWWNHKHFPFMIAPSEVCFTIDESDAGRKKQAELIGKQISAADIIWHAADRDREGQLIVDELLEYFKKDVGNKPVKRLIYSAIDDAAFDVAMKNVGNNRDPKYVNAGRAALARSVADAYIGIPGTRVLTSLLKGKGILSLGRVQSPILSIVCERFIANRDFKSKAFYTILIALPDGTEMKLKKGKPSDTGYDEDGRLVDYEIARKIVAEIEAAKVTGQITFAKRGNVEIKPPLPFDLPSLQSFMSKKHGLSVAETTDACQQLYNKKMQTYIGTECRYLPTSMLSDINKIMKHLRSSSPQMKYLVENADTDRRSDCWNDSKVTAHHAIIPTGTAGMCDNEAERMVHDVVCRRYVAQFYPPAVKMTERLEAEFAGHKFESVTSKLISRGWTEVEDDSLDEETKNDDIAVPIMKNAK